MTNFDTAWQHLMKMEGGGLFVNNPRDPGGATKWGITLNTLRQYRNKSELIESDIFDLTEQEAKEICFNLYWIPLGLDKVGGWKFCLVLLDQAFNRGVETVLKQWKAIEDLPFDWTNIQPLERFLIESQRSYIELVHKNPHLLEFLPGWINRTLELFRVLSEGI